jgi:hypothetical protein
LRQGLLAERRGQIGITYHSIHARFAPDVDTMPWSEAMRDYLRAIGENPDEPEAHYRFGVALWVNGFTSGVRDLHNAHLYRRLGLGDLADREYCAAPVLTQ